MILIETDKKLSLREMGIPYKMAKAIKEVQDGSVDYTIVKNQDDATEAILMGMDKFNALVANLDPALSLPVKLKSMDFDMVSAGIRASEIYHLVLAKSNFPGNDEYSASLHGQGFEHKIVVKGTQLDNQVENSESDTSTVTAVYPIWDVGGVSVRKAGGPLEVVAIADAKLGVVEIADEGDPVVDGVAVELVYQTKEHLVINLLNQHKVAIACIVSKELNDYLVANAL